MSSWGEPLRAALRSLAGHKLRSGLTLLGVVIGVGTIIAMQSVVAGLQGAVAEQLNLLGAATFQIQKHASITIGGSGMNGGDRERPDLTLAQARELRARSRQAVSVGAEVYRFTAVVSVPGEHTDPNVQIAGAEPAFAEANGVELDRGRFLTADDVRRARRVTVLGADLRARLFPYSDPVGSSVRIDGRSFRVVGTLAARGAAFGRSRDNLALIPITAFQAAYGKDASVNITVRAASSTALPRSEDEAIGIMRVLRRLRAGEANNFATWSSASLVETFKQLTGAVAAAAIGIAAISLLVAGIGIMNIMLVAVTERTREIGIRKAVGATRAHLLRQFLLEAVVLTEAGGVLGVVLGIGVGAVVRLATGLPTRIPLAWIPASFLFCSLIGVIFGVYPAAKAARLDPIDALHYE